jgi:GT2 family glycosyltransferase
LSACLNAIAATTACDYEVIVVDGASTDDTIESIVAARDLLGHRLKVIYEQQREGFVRAANKGFRAATGRCVTWLNDDARPLAGSLDRAVEQLDRFAASGVGVVAMYHRFEGTKNVAYEVEHGGATFRLLHVRGTLYANFGVGRLATWRDVGFFDERYFLNAADPDLSLKLWHAGYSVVPALGSFIDHDEHDDDRRATDSERARADNARLFSKWDLPPKNPQRNDFNPSRPCTLRGLNVQALAA